MEQNIVTIRPLIAYDKANKVWHVEAKLLKVINLLSNGRGILDQALHFKVLKEYNRHRGLYNLSHGSTILCLVSLRLAFECRSTRHHPQSSYRYLADTVAKEVYLPTEISYLAYRLYPAIPEESLKILLALLKRVSGLMSTGNIPRSEIDLTEHFVLPGLSQFIAHFYTNWEKHVVSPHLWFNDCLHTLSKQSYQQGFQQTAEKIIADSMEEYIEKGFNMEGVKRKKWYHHIWETIAG